MPTNVDAVTPGDSTQADRLRILPHFSGGLLFGLCLLASLALGGCHHHRKAQGEPGATKEMHFVLRQEPQVRMVGVQAKPGEDLKALLSGALETAQAANWTGAGEPVLIFPSWLPMSIFFPVAQELTPPQGWTLVTRPPQKVFAVAAKGDPIDVQQKSLKAFKAFAARQGQPCAGPPMVRLLGDPRRASRSDPVKLELLCAVKPAKPAALPPKEASAS